MTGVRPATTRRLRPPSSSEGREHARRVLALCASARPVRCVGATGLQTRAPPRTSRCGRAGAGRWSRAGKAARADPCRPRRSRRQRRARATAASSRPVAARRAPARSAVSARRDHRPGFSGGHGGDRSTASSSPTPPGAAPSREQHWPVEPRASDQSFGSGRRTRILVSVATTKHPAQRSTSSVRKRHSM